LFGLRIPQNFNSPYKALDPSDFWRRWHISLSTCLRDYLYIPLGGNRLGELVTYRNLLLTMLIGGLWHGANWTFVVWGAYHGLLLALYRRFGVHWDRLPPALRRVATFVLIVVGWVLFRSTDFTMAWTVLGKMFAPAPGVVFAGVPLFATIALIAALWSMMGPNAFDVDQRWSFKPKHAFAVAAAFGVCLALMAGTGSSPFLYFQF
jgi:alginate O-acetyltransferase complex protein AlgI